MNVLYRAFFIDDAPHWNRIEAAFGNDWINSLQHVFALGVVLDTHREFTAASSRNGTGLSRQGHFAHFLDETLHQLCITTGEDELDHIAADLSRQYVQMQFGE